MGNLPLVSLGLLAWAGALFGVLRIGLASGHGLHEHSLCGPWGCGPPTSALVGWHGFWLLLAGPPVGFVVYAWPARRMRNLGVALSVASVLVLLGVGIWEAATWLPKISPGEPTYMVQRYLFSVITMTDVPTIPLTLSGLVLLIAWRTKIRRQRITETENDFSAETTVSTPPCPTDA